MANDIFVCACAAASRRRRALCPVSLSPFTQYNPRLLLFFFFFFSFTIAHLHSTYLSAISRRAALSRGGGRGILGNDRARIILIVREKNLPRLAPPVSVNSTGSAANYRNHRRIYIPVYPPRDLDKYFKRGTREYESTLSATRLNNCAINYRHPKIIKG